MFKQKDGITLIALIITVIVLLILAGVVINMTIGNDGIISKAQGAVDMYKNATEKEEYQIAKVAEDMQEYIDGDRGNKVTYSSGEQVIGTWVNGKPIYQKTLTGATVPANGTILISNVDTVINAFGSQIYGPSSEVFHFPYTEGTEVRWIKNTSNQILLLNSYNVTLSNYAWTFQYTKTTDQASN